MEKNTKMAVFTLAVDDGGSRKTGWQRKWLDSGVDVLLSVLIALWILVYDIIVFTFTFTVSTYMSKVMVQFIAGYVLAYFVNGRIYDYNSLLEIEVAVVVLIFIVAEIQPEVERRFVKRVFPTGLPRMTSLTIIIVTCTYIMLASVCVPLLVMTFQIRFCVSNVVDIGSLAGPFEAFMEQAPYLLSICFMVSGNFMTKLYVQGKESGINILSTCTGLMCKLVCPIRMTPPELQLDRVTIEYFFYGMIHEALEFVVLMVLPTYLIMDIWTSIYKNEVVAVGHSMFGLTMLGFPMTYISSHIDECSIAFLTTRSKPRVIVEKQRLGMVQGGLTSDLLVCVSSLIGILCNFYSDSVGDVCIGKNDWYISNRFALNMNSQAVQSFIAFITFMIYAVVKMIIVSDWVAEETTEELPYFFVDQPMESKPKENVKCILLQDGAGALLSQVEVRPEKPSLSPPCGIHV